MNGVNPNRKNSKHGRSRLQFPLSALFALSAVCAVIIVIPVNGYRQKEHALARLGELGASVSFDFQWTESEAWMPDAALPGNAALKMLLGKHYAANPIEAQLFAGPSMTPDEFTDEDAAMLANLPSLRWLVLQDTQLTDAGLMRLLSLPSLERLDIEGTRVTPAGARKFQTARPAVKIFYSNCKR